LSNEGEKYVQKVEDGTKNEVIDARHRPIFYNVKNIIFVSQLIGYCCFGFCYYL